MGRREGEGRRRGKKTGPFSALQHFKKTTIQTHASMWGGMLSSKAEGPRHQGGFKVRLRTRRKGHVGVALELNGGSRLWNIVHNRASRGHSKPRLPSVLLCGAIVGVARAARQQPPRPLLDGKRLGRRLLRKVLLVG